MQVLDQTPKPLIFLSVLGFHLARPSQIAGFAMFKRVLNVHNFANKCISPQ